MNASMAAQHKKKRGTRAPHAAWSMLDWMDGGLGESAYGGPEKPKGGYNNPEPPLGPDPLKRPQGYPPPPQHLSALAGWVGAAGWGGLLCLKHGPVVLWRYWGAQNHVPVHSLISANAQVRGLKHARCSKTQRAYGLKQLWRCAGGIFYLSCEECSLFSPP